MARLAFRRGSSARATRAARRGANEAMAASTAAALVLAEAQGIASPRSGPRCPVRHASSKRPRRWVCDAGDRAAQKRAYGRSFMTVATSQCTEALRAATKSQQEPRRLACDAACGHAAGTILLQTWCGGRRARALHPRLLAGQAVPGRWTSFPWRLQMLGAIGGRSSRCALGERTATLAVWSGQRRAGLEASCRATPTAQAEHRS